MEATIETDMSGFDAMIDRLIEDTDPARGTEIREAMIEASGVYWESMRQRFAAASDRDGTWAEHAPSTIKRRGAGAPILIETGQLGESLSRDDDAHILEVDGDTVIEGTSDRTAAYHQTGTDHMPAREILVEPDSETLEQMGEIIGGGVLSIAKGGL